MRLAVLVPVGFVLGWTVSGLLLRNAPFSVHTDLAQPLVVVTYWGTFGAKMSVALFLAFAIAAVGYVDVLRSANVRRAGTWCAMACLGALAFPVVYSSDVYAYAGYGAMALHGIDPYAHARLALQTPLLTAMIWQWGNPPPMCVYGPAFVWFAQAIVFAARENPLLVLWLLRIAACGALVACVPLARAAFASRGERGRDLAAAAITLNPVAIWSCAEGHNDVFVLVLVLGGFALVQRNRAFAGAFLLAATPLVKLVGLAASFGLVLRSVCGRTRLPAIAAGTIAGLLLSAVVSFPLEHGLQAHLAPAGHYFPQFSLQAVLRFALSPTATIACTAVVVLALAIPGALRLARGDRTGAAWLAFAAWLAIPNPYPWYALWVLPVAVYVWDEPEGAALLTLTIACAARYLGDATALQFSTGATIAIVACQLLAPAAVYVLARNHPHRHKSTGRNSVAADGDDLHLVRSS